jgi:hypothetical protein
MVRDCATTLSVEDKTNLGVYRSSEWAERAFCKQCGTHLYYRLHATGEYFVPAGAFESQDFELATQIYIDKKPGYYDFANQTPTMTEAEVIAQYAPPQE